MHVLSQYAPVSWRCHSRIIYRHGLPRDGERRDIPACTAAISARDRDGDGSRGRCGGIGGFFLPNILGTLKQITGTYSSGFLTFTVIAFLALGLLLLAQTGWKKVENRGEINSNIKEPLDSFRAVFYSCQDRDDWMLV